MRALAHSPTEPRRHAHRPAGRGRRIMTCRELLECVGDYLARDLGPHARRRFETHLAACPDCVTYVRGYADTIQLARAAYDQPGLETTAS